jgi:hypothetical protein
MRFFILAALQLVLSRGFECASEQVTSYRNWVSFSYKYNKPKLSPDLVAATDVLKLPGDCLQKAIWIQVFVSVASRVFEGKPLIAHLVTSGHNFDINWSFRNTDIWIDYGNSRGFRGSQALYEELVIFRAKLNMLLAIVDAKPRDYANSSIHNLLESKEALGLGIGDFAIFVQSYIPSGGIPDRCVGYFISARSVYDKRFELQSDTYRERKGYQSGHVSKKFAPTYVLRALMIYYINKAEFSLTGAQYPYRIDSPGLDQLTEEDMHFIWKYFALTLEDKERGTGWVWKNKYSNILKLLADKEPPSNPAVVELAGTLYVYSVLGYLSDADLSTYAIIGDWGPGPLRQSELDKIYLSLATIKESRKAHEYTNTMQIVRMQMRRGLKNFLPGAREFFDVLNV